MFLSDEHVAVWIEDMGFGDIRGQFGVRGYKVKCHYGGDVFACFYTHDIIRDARETPISRTFYRLTQKGIQIAPKPLIALNPLPRLFSVAGRGSLTIYSHLQPELSPKFFFFSIHWSAIAANHSFSVLFSSWSPSIQSTIPE